MDAEHILANMKHLHSDVTRQTMETVEQLAAVSQTVTAAADRVQGVTNNVEAAIAAASKTMLQEFSRLQQQKTREKTWELKFAAPVLLFSGFGIGILFGSTTVGGEWPFAALLGATIGFFISPLVIAAVENKYCDAPATNSAKPTIGDSQKVEIPALSPQQQKTEEYFLRATFNAHLAPRVYLAAHDICVNLLPVPVSVVRHDANYPQVSEAIKIIGKKMQEEAKKDEANKDNCENEKKLIFR